MKRSEYIISRLRNATERDEVRKGFQDSAVLRVAECFNRSFGIIEAHITPRSLAFSDNFIKFIDLAAYYGYITQHSSAPTEAAQHLKSKQSQRTWSNLLAAYFIRIISLGFSRIGK